MKKVFLKIQIILCLFFIFHIKIYAQETYYLGQWENSQTEHTGSIIDFIVKDATYIEVVTETSETIKYKVDHKTPEIYRGKFSVDENFHEIEIFVDSIVDRTKPVEIKEIRTDGIIANSTKEQYLFIGDSLWEGTNVEGVGLSSYEKSIPYWLGEELDVIPITIAAPGSGVVKTEIYSTIEDMAFKSPINANPTKILLSMGTNDMKLGITSDHEREGMQHLINTLQTRYPEARIYVLVPLYYQIYTEVIHSLEGIEIIESAGWEDIEYTDTIHPNEKSARRIAKLIKKQIVE